MSPIRLSVAAAALAVLAFAPAAMADIFSYKDDRGVVHFTNINPQDRRWKLVRKEEGSPSSGAPVVGGNRGISGLFMPSQADMLRYASLIDAASKNHGVDSALVHAVITAESGYNARALSRAGAQGLMQLMPDTARRFGVQNSWDPAENINGGVKYLKELIAMFDGNLELAVAAYNAGENAVIRHGRKIPPYAETVHYVPKVLGFYKKFQTRAL